VEITVAVCAKNAEGVITECLESINNQTVKPERIIVVDDHSEDQTADIARSYGAAVILNEGCQLYDGRNTVLKNCSTELLAFTDADCVLDKQWVANILKVFKEHNDVAGGTGRHPPLGSNGFAGWLHHQWFIVETEKTGYTKGVIGGNCYFKTEALKKVGGWLSLPYSNAEDVYITTKLTGAGYKLWFDEKIIAHHNYSNKFIPLIKKTVISGEAITFMMKLAGFRNFLWWFTLAIPIVALAAVCAFLLLFYSVLAGAVFISIIFGSTLGFWTIRFKSLATAFPRVIARWILIWPYSVGVIRGFFKKVNIGAN
jgi:glycosyltransferase involved in cell wall biosynthesis